jgi:thioredoxin-dependent peroxiredoxin
MRLTWILAVAGVAFVACKSSQTVPAYEGQVVEAAAPGSIPVVGQEAPVFRLTSNEGAEISLDAMRGKWVVLYFYPKDFSGGCTAEAQNFQRDIERYEGMDAVILGVSVDSVESHREFCTKEGLTFRLLADVQGTVSALYGSLNERDGNRFSARNTFLIDPQGRVARVFAGVKPTAHSTEVLAALAEMRGRRPVVTD